MTNVSNQMACNFAGAIARVWRICPELGIKNKEYALLCIYQVFALSAGLFGCRLGLQFSEANLLSKQKPKSIMYAFWMLWVWQEAKTHVADHGRQASCLFISTVSFVLSTFGTACWQPLSLLSKIDQADLLLVCMQAGFGTFLFTTGHGCPCIRNGCWLRKRILMVRLNSFMVRYARDSRITVIYVTPQMWFGSFTVQPVPCGNTAVQTFDSKQ